jgi:hypothetical protein
MDWKTYTADTLALFPKLPIERLMGKGHEKDKKFFSAERKKAEPF